MAEIREIPWNGLTVASTFSGAGGSSLGYRMAGYRVLYANEFVKLALNPPLLLPPPLLLLSLPSPLRPRRPFWRACRATRVRYRR